MNQRAADIARSGLTFELRHEDRKRGGDQGHLQPHDQKNHAEPEHVQPEFFLRARSTDDDPSCERGGARHKLVGESQTTDTQNRIAEGFRLSCKPRSEVGVHCYFFCEANGFASSEIILRVRSFEPRSSTWGRASDRTKIRVDFISNAYLILRRKTKVTRKAHQACADVICQTKVVLGIPYLASHRRGMQGNIVENGQYFLRPQVVDQPISQFLSG